MLLWQSLTVHFNFGGNWTALFCTGDTFAVPPELASSTYIFRGSNGYDGQFYRYIARNPDPAGPYASYIDDPRLRYRRILLPLLAHLTGRSDAALIALIAVFSALGVYWTSQHLAHHHRNAAGGLIFLLMPATLTSIDRILLDGPLLALFAAFLLYRQEERWRALAIVCTVAPLVRETGVILPAAIVLEQLVARRWARATLFAAAAAPALLWWIYVAIRTPTSHASVVFSWPIAGIVTRLFTPRVISDPLTQSILRTTDVLALLGLLASLLLVVRELPALRNAALRYATAAFAVLGAFLTGGQHLSDPYGFARPVSPALLMLALAGLQGRSRWNLFPPLSLSAAIAVYFASPALGVLQRVATLIRTYL